MCHKQENQVGGKMRGADTWTVVIAVTRSVGKSMWRTRGLLLYVLHGLPGVKITWLCLEAKHQGASRGLYRPSKWLPALACAGRDILERTLDDRAVLAQQLDNPH